MDAHVVEDAEAEERVAISRQPARGDERAGSRAEEGEELVGGRAGERRDGGGRGWSPRGEDGGFGAAPGGADDATAASRAAARARGTARGRPRRGCGGARARERRARRRRRARATPRRGARPRRTDRRPGEPPASRGTTSTGRPRRRCRRNTREMPGRETRDALDATCDAHARDRRPRQPTDTRGSDISPPRARVCRGRARARRRLSRGRAQLDVCTRTADMITDHDFPHPVALKSRRARPLLLLSTLPLSPRVSFIPERAVERVRDVKRQLDARQLLPRDVRGVEHDDVASVPRGVILEVDEVLVLLRFSHVSTASRLGTNSTSLGNTPGPWFASDASRRP